MCVLLALLACSGIFIGAVRYWSVIRVSDSTLGGTWRSGSIVRYCSRRDCLSTLNTMDKRTLALFQGALYQQSSPLRLTPPYHEADARSRENNVIRAESSLAIWVLTSANEAYLSEHGVTPQPLLLHVRVVVRTGNNKRRQLA